MPKVGDLHVFEQIAAFRMRALEQVATAQRVMDAIRPPTFEMLKVLDAMSKQRTIAAQIIGSRGFQQQTKFAADLVASVGRINLLNLKPLAGPMIDFPKLASPLIDFGKIWQRQAQPMYELMRDWEKRMAVLTAAEQRALDLLAPRGWLISPSLTSRAPIDMLKVIEEEGVETLEQQLVEVFDAEFCTKIISGLFDRPSYEVWRPKLERALEAHRRGEYDLAVPIWLIALDGIASTELQTEERRPKDLFRLVRVNKGKTLHNLLQVGNVPFFRPLSEALVKVLYLFARAPKDADAVGPVLRRHGVLHGEDPNFGSEKDSIQCILVLEVLHFCLGHGDGHQSAD